MFGADALTFREFAMREPLPLATVHNAVLEFVRGRENVAVFGAHAVNAYVDEPRMTQDVDLLCTNASALADDLIAHLRERFHIAVRACDVSDGRGFRIFQLRKEGNRHLVDIRQVQCLPDTQRVEGVLVVAPAALIAEKVIAYQNRRGQPKSGTDWRDLAFLLLRFPELKSESGLVGEELRAASASPEVMSAWRELVAQELRLAEDDGEF